MPFRQAVRVALAADTVSIAVMEVCDNAVVLAVPGAMDAGLGDLLFWGSLAFSFVVAFCVTVPVNRWLIGRGRGHAVSTPTTDGRCRPLLGGRTLRERRRTRGRARCRALHGGDGCSRSNTYSNEARRNRAARTALGAGHGAVVRLARAAASVVQGGAPS